MKYLLLLLLLVGCTSSLRVKSEPVERVPLNISDPSPIQTKPVVPVLENNLICVDESNYKNLLYNAALLQNWIILERQTLESYRQYYEK